MNPIKKTGVKTFEYWDCGNEKHIHKTKDTAIRCMEQQARRKHTPSKEERYLMCIKVARMVVNGSTFKSAGESIGASSCAAREITHKVLSTAWRMVPETEAIPCSYRKIKEVRENKDYWLGRIDRVALLWGVTESY
jgi:hypothetical protein